ncbi:hypothetical protein CY35_02G106400 [Sphagnum magellanicum]|nr:hypothetical protein CY35_02G106400 [Sphagnum magellanicum]
MMSTSGGRRGLRGAAGTGGGEGAGTTGGVQIPASARKVVQSLKEIVGNSDDEIYSMLKECNMDLNETVQRLLNDDNFHEVKRKRDKNKESAAIKDSVELRGRPGSRGDSHRTGFSGIGRGGSSFHQPSHGGRGKLFAARENGVHPSKRVSPAMSAPTDFAPPHVQPSAVSPPLQTQSSITHSSEGLPNGGSSHAEAPLVSQGAWSSGHTTMADILKFKAKPPLPTAGVQSPGPGPASSSSPVVAPATVQHPVGYSLEMSPTTSSLSSGFQSSSTDPVLPPLLDPHTQGVIKQDLGAVQIQWPIGDWSVNSLETEVRPVPTTPPQASVKQIDIPAPAAASSTLETDLEAKAIRPTTISPILMDNFPSGQAATVSLAETANDLGWNHKANLSEVGVDAPEPSEAVEEIDDVASKLHVLSMEDNQPVIIPDHLKVPEAEYTYLSFGSFGTDFKIGSVASYGLEEAEQGSVATMENTPVDDTVEEAEKPSVSTTVALAESYGHQTQSTPVENLTARNEVASVSLSAPVAPVAPVAQSVEHSKAENMVQQGPPYPYMPAVSNYHGLTLMPQIPGGSQYAYEPTDPQADVSRVPSLMPYTDAIMSYHTLGFQPGTDGDARYTPYITSNATSKFSGNIDTMSGVASAFPSQELQGPNSLISSSGPSFAPTAQPGSNPPIALSTPQQALPVHAYAAQPTRGHYGNFLGYQYMQPNYSYMQTPYHHNYSPTNTVYTQAPAGSSYPPPVASPAYLAGVATPLKYSWPHYKTSAASGNPPLSPSAAVGYGGYNSTPSGYTINPAVIAVAPDYEDVGGSQYKDNTVYIPSQQQVEGSTVWIPTHLPRDMGSTGGMQTNSYYNHADQGHHIPYSLSQQSAPTHMQTYPTNHYHPSQSGSSSRVHQMLQRPLAMGGGTSSATQAGGYQQAQHSLQTWTNNY